MSNRVSACDGRAGRHVAEPVSLRQGDLPVGDDRHGDAGELVLIEVGLQGLRDAVGQVGRRGRVGRTRLAGGHEQARIERLGLGPRPPSCAPSGPIGRPGGADPAGSDEGRESCRRAKRRIMLVLLKSLRPSGWSCRPMRWPMSIPRTELCRERSAMANANRQPRLPSNSRFVANPDVSPAHRSL